MNSNCKTPSALTLVRCAAALALVCLVASVAIVSGWESLLPFVGLGLGMGFMKKDNDSQVYVTKALPSAGGNTVSTDGIDLQNTARGDFLANCEVLVEAPALNTTELPNTETMTYDLYHAASSDFSDEELLQDNVITQTGADGAGDAAAEKRVRLPVDVDRYIRLKATSSATAGDASGESVSLRLVF